MQNGQQMRFSELELNNLKAAFAGNDELLKLLRKIFLPEIDATMPLGQNIDLWMTVPTEGMSTEDIVINLKARNSLIQHVEQRLQQISLLAGVKAETVEETKARLEANSSK